MLQNDISKQFVLQKIFDIINDCENNVEGRDNQTLLKCLDMLNKMGGFYKPIITIHQSTPPPLFPDIDNNIEDVNIEEE